MMVDTLKVYVTVVEQSNFSRAAKMLNLSQPGVSLHIRNLENEFGVKLIHRSSKHVKMTEAGEILYERAKQMLSLFDAAKEEIHLLRDEVTGSLKIGASYTIGEYILPRLIAEFAQQYPQVDVHATIANTEDIAQAVRTNELDIGLVEGKVDYADIQVKHPFMEDEMVLVVPPDHPLSSARGADAAMLQHQVWILRENGSGTRSYCDQFIKDLGLAVKRIFVFNSNQGVKEAVMAGLGAALLSRWVIRKELEAGELCSIQVKGARITRQFFILQDTKTSSTMAMKMFVQKLRQLNI
ncbi:LysR substrate-binding domain-containing protein [Paenibacillus apiarius]|uniref:LysR substrate-binding domain-containing protein n=1 Tax=Paenibacillus apiarius TaxID=46240 RepID=A0ABT4DR25_9BACL|nr:LysR substrate-binding domain-containing protein [Paenibacillus apiarius]MCY9514573.1 LysR substrate-binding domain-containing protein [Paenibacillus apiarius]MCY9518563.1 LysR substrate-binding domain-containing protein [Paenibacillus apiarius]MCY9552651.1 LysR substrate-binding domain-containing protein [Paenibacillus apiarius]MCY9557021.1 LysR substrate-binding domain-containing protein [Paenibacillus apiarius]MCY9686026.1 LysR substrate-binding domain-containing protein [Paenibacillus a